MPWVLPLVLLGLVAYGDPLADLARRLLAPSWRVLALSAVAIAFALPHVGYMWKLTSIGGFFQTKPACDAPWRIGVEEFHSCQHELMWFRRPLSTYAVSGLGTRGGAVTSVVLAVGLIGCAFALRDELGRSPSRR
jgi:hypothetical protein